jgi:hypothetical protein
MATQAQARKVRVNRPFFLDGKRVEVGAEVVLPLALAGELMTARKCEPAEIEPTAEHLRAKAEADMRAPIKPPRSAAV